MVNRQRIGFAAHGTRRDNRGGSEAELETARLFDAAQRANAASEVAPRFFHGSLEQRKRDAEFGECRAHRAATIPALAHRRRMSRLSP